MTRTPPASGARPRTLTEAIRGFDREQLAELVRRRPDLSYPVPENLTELATRAGTGTSVVRALDGLDAWARLVAEALAASPDPTTEADLATLLGARPGEVHRALADLQVRALLWGDPDLHLVRSARDYFEPYPGGLAAPSPHPLSDADITALLTECDPACRGVLERLTWSPAGAVRNAERVIEASAARSPVEQLLARRLLRPLDSDTVLLPREVAWRLRGGRFAAEPVLRQAPPVSGRQRSPELTDKAAAGAAYELIDDVERLVQLLEEVPRRLLRDGGLAVRDTTGLARALHGDVSRASFLVECAASAGLVSGSGGHRLLPTAAYDHWATRSAAERWQVLAAAWRSAERSMTVPAGSGRHPLGPEAASTRTAALRGLVLESLVAVERGTEPDLDDLVAAVAWRRPRVAGRPGDAADAVRVILGEAAQLGLTGLGSVSGFLLATTTELPLPVHLAELFPAPVDHVVIQADLTAVAPGPLPYAMAAELRLLADRESRGGAGVFRFSAASIRRALDAGWSVEDARQWLERHSATGVPQPLAYLLSDVARRHGTIRVGAVSSYVRTDDPALAAALLAHPDAPVLGLRSIGDGVLVSPADSDELVSLLRRLGHSPAAEDHHGRSVRQPLPPRAPARPAARRASRPNPADVVAAVLDREATRAAPDMVEATLEALRSATEHAHSVRVVWVGPDGEQRQHDLEPLDVVGGSLRAVDAAAAEVRTIPLARVLSVRLR